MGELIRRVQLGKLRPRKNSWSEHKAQLSQAMDFSRRRNGHQGRLPILVGEQPRKGLDDVPFSIYCRSGMSGGLWALQGPTGGCLLFESPSVLRSSQSPGLALRSPALSLPVFLSKTHLNELFFFESPFSTETKPNQAKTPNKQKTNLYSDVNNWDGIRKVCFSGKDSLSKMF